MKTFRRSNDEPPLSGNDRLWKIAAFIGALALIAVASHIFGGASGRWARRHWSADAVIPAAPAGRFWGMNCGMERERENNDAIEASLEARRIATSVGTRNEDIHAPEQVTVILARS